MFGTNTLNLAFLVRLSAACMYASEISHTFGECVRDVGIYMRQNVRDI